MIRSFLYVLIALFVSFFLVCCSKGEKFKDLESYIKQLEQTTTGKKPVTSKALITLAPSQYQKASTRNPFAEAIVAHSGADASDHPLKRFQLNLFRFVGTVTKNNQIYAYVIAPDNKVYEVKKGDTIGDHNGRIVNVSPNKLEIIEQFNDEDRSGTERIITLQLKDEN